MKDILSAEEKKMLHNDYLTSGLDMPEYAEKLAGDIFGLEPEEAEISNIDRFCEDNKEHWDKDRYITCTRCGTVDADQVEDRYSFGVYAGRLCVSCCAGYRDNCGIDQDQGDPTTLHEFEAGGWDAINGEDY